MSEGFIGALVGGIVVLIPAIAGGVHVFRKSKQEISASTAKAEQEAEDHAVKHFAAASAVYKEALETERKERSKEVGELRELLDQHRKHLDDAQNLADELFVKHNRCEMGQVELYSCLERHRDWWLASIRAIKIGQDPGEPPEMPKRPQPDLAPLERRARTNAMTTELLQKTAPPPGGGGT